MAEQPIIIKKINIEQRQRLVSDDDRRIHAGDVITSDMRPDFFEWEAQIKAGKNK